MDLGLGRLGRSAKQTFGSYGAGTNGTNGNGAQAAPGADQKAAADSGQDIPVFREMPDVLDAQATEQLASDDGATAAHADTTSQRQPAAPTGHLVYDLLKGLDVGFGIEAAQLEREAITAAREWAEKGLPRHDLEPSGPLDVEVTLARRGAQVFAGWVRQVRARMNGAIQQETERLGTHLVRLEQQMLRYRLLLDSLRATRRDLAVAEAEDVQAEVEAARAPKRRLTYERHMGAIGYWLLLACLVAADFVANVPVFNELLPASATADLALRNLETNASATPLWYGLKSFFGKLVIHPEATILAFTVILFLVFLGHQAGASLRTIVALHGTESKVADDLLLHHKRRPFLPAWASIIGVLAIVGVLFAARQKIEPAARARLESAQVRLDSATSRLAAAQAAGDPQRVQELDLERQQIQATIGPLQARHEYTQTVSNANVPIAVLNLVLALVAGIAAYQHQSEVMEVEPARSPAAVAARTRYTTARAAVDEVRHGICELSTQFDQGATRIQHLLDSRPLLESDGKIQRLRRVIPSFRAENQRARGMDQQSIRAFQQPVPEVIPDIDLAEPFRAPDGLPSALERYADLRTQFAALERDREAATEVAA